MKLVIPLLLALALLPVNVFAEGGVDTAKGGKATTSTLDNPGVGRVITDEGIIGAEDDPDLPEWAKKNKKKRLELGLTKDEPETPATPTTPAATGDVVPAVPGINQYSPSHNNSKSKLSGADKLKKSSEQGSTLFSSKLALKLGQEYIYELPGPEKKRVEACKNELYRACTGVVVDLDKPKFRWKYIGTRKVDKKTKHIWLTAIHAKGASSIGFPYTRFNLCPQCAIFVYSIGADQEVSQNSYIRYRRYFPDHKPQTVRGDTVYIEYQSEHFDVSPEATNPSPFSEYYYGTGFLKRDASLSATDLNKLATNNFTVQSVALLNIRTPSGLVGKCTGLVMSNFPPHSSTPHLLGLS